MNMRLLPFKFLCILAFSLGLCQANQLPSALIDSIYPPSGTRGTEVELTVKGKYLDDAESLLFSDPSLKAKPKKGGDGEIVPNTFLVPVPGNLVAGRYTVSVRGGKFGISNEKSFVVNDLPEIDLGEIGDTMETADEIKFGHTAVGYPKASRYGWMRVALKANQKIVIESEGDQIDSKFSPCLAIFDQDGRKLKSSTRTGFLVFQAKQDGEIFLRLHDFLFKGGAEYLFRMSVTERPRIQFVDPPLARIGAPQKMVVYGWNLPGGQPAGLKVPGMDRLERKDVSLHLPSENEIQDPLQTRNPIESTQRRHDYRISSPEGNSLPFSLAVCPAEWVKEQPGSEQIVKLSPPCEFVGSFFPARDQDRFRFEAKKGDAYKIEIHCERLGFPSHSYLLVEQVTPKDDGSETRKTIAQSDKTDHPSSNSFLHLSSRDPSLRFTAPADGTFEILAYDMFSLNGDPFKSYRLSIRKESPDFDLIAYPLLAPPASNNQSPIYVKSPTLRARESFPVRVAVDRKDGFEGEVKLEFEGLPAGIDYFPRRIPEGANSAVVLLRTDAFPENKPWHGKYSITGTAKVGDRPVVRSCKIAKLCWSDYNNQSKLALSKIRMSEAGNLAVLPKAEAPLDLTVNWNKMSDQVGELIEKTDKTIKALKDSEAKALKKKTDSEAKMAELAKSMEAFVKEKEDKEKRQKVLNETEVPKAKEVLELAEAELKTAKAKKAEKGLSPEQLSAVEDSLKKATEKVTQATAGVNPLEKEAKALVTSLKSTYSATEIKKRELALAKAKLESETNSFAWQKEKAKLANRAKILARAKKKSDELAGRIKTPSSDPLILETVLGGTLNLPVSLEAKDKSFATPTKVSVMGAVAASKIKEITIDPKKKKEGDLAINLTQAKFPAGEFNLVCLARGKGKYRLYDELEKNATEQRAKVVTDSFAALKKETDDAKKKLDTDKKVLATKEAELKKSDAALLLAEKESGKLSGELKAAEAKLIKARETLKKQEAVESPEEAKLAALKKSLSDAEKSVASLRGKSQVQTRDKVEPAKGKKEELTKESKVLRDRIALAETSQSGLAEKLKLMEGKKKKSDARLKVVKDAFAKPIDLNLAHFDLPFVLRVKKAPFVFEELPSLELKPGEPALLPVQIDREHDFEDAITLKLILPKEAKGITLKSQNIDKSESLGEIKLTPQAQASAGKHSCTLEASFRYKNQNLKLSQSFELTVLPALKKPS